MQRTLSLRLALAVSQQGIGASSSQMPHVSAARNPMKNSCHYLFLFCGDTPESGKVSYSITAACLVTVAQWVWAFSDCDFYAKGGLMKERGCCPFKGWLYHAIENRPGCADGKPGASLRNYSNKSLFLSRLEAT